MRAVIQRVNSASVVVDLQTVGSIQHGLLILLGVSESDEKQDAEYLVQKISQLRIFADAEEKMNLSIKDVKGAALVISQFTLFAQTKKGNRPSYIKAARPEIAIPLYEYFCDSLRLAIDNPVEKGVFGADMKVSLLNDGPVTIIIDSQNKDL